MVIFEHLLCYLPHQDELIRSPWSLLSFVFLACFGAVFEIGVIISTLFAVTEYVRNESKVNCTMQDTVERMYTLPVTILLCVFVVNTWAYECYYFSIHKTRHESRTTCTEWLQSKFYTQVFMYRKKTVRVLNFVIAFLTAGWIIYGFALLVSMNEPAKCQDNLFNLRAVFFFVVLVIFFVLAFVHVLLKKYCNRSPEVNAQSAKEGAAGEFYDV